MTTTLDDCELATLGALAETLIPTDETPGANPAWARAFLVEHVRRHPTEHVGFRMLASHVDALAMTGHGQAFALLTVSDREALLLAHHPTLGDDADLDREERAFRRAMRDIIAGFLTADELDIRDDPFWLRPDAPHRDRAAASSPDFAAADSVPDLAIDRRMATTSGRGTYARVWRAAGYAVPPGLPQAAADLVRIPIRTKR